MQTVTTVGLDIAKSVFQVHGVDGGGQVVIRRQLKRTMSWPFSSSCRRVWLVSKPVLWSHHWSRRTASAWTYRSPDAACLR